MEKIDSTYFDAVLERRDTDSLKWARYEGTDVLPMWVADMDFRSPPAVKRELRRRVDQGIYGYTLPPKELVNIIRASLLRLYGWHIEEKWIVWLPGLVTGINVACRGVGETGDQVLTTVPIYPPFLTAPELSERTCVRLPMYNSQNGIWRIDMDAFKKVIGPRTKLLLFCNPHNPTGRVFLEEEVSEVAEICLRNDIVICSDEVHCDLILDKDKLHIPTASLGADVSRRTITLMAPSKTYNIPGLGCAYAIIEDAVLRRRFKSVMAGIVPEVNLMGYSAALAAYRESEEWLEELLQYLGGNRDLLEKELEALPGLQINHVEATYLAWIDARLAGLEDPASFFEKAGVGFFDGKYFGTPGFLRLNFGCPRSLLLKSIERIKKVL